MTVDSVTLERPQTCNQRSSSRQVASATVTITHEKYRATLERLMDLTTDTANTAERLKGLQKLVMATFCDNLTASDMPLELITAAWVVADCMSMLAERLERNEDLARARFSEELAKVA